MKFVSLSRLSVTVKVIRVCTLPRLAMAWIHQHVQLNLSLLKVRPIRLSLDFLFRFICLFFLESDEEKKAIAEQNTPHFIVRLKDTEIMENTFLRFMVKIQGEPRPKISL